MATFDTVPLKVLGSIDHIEVRSRWGVIVRELKPNALYTSGGDCKQSCDSGCNDSSVEIGYITAM